MLEIFSISPLLVVNNMENKRKRDNTSSYISKSKKKSKLCEEVDEEGPNATSEAERLGLKGAPASSEISLDMGAKKRVKNVHILTQWTGHL